MRKLSFIMTLLFVLVVSACAPATPVVKDMILATTTSTQDSGLLDVLVPEFQDQTGYVVKVIAVGTGQALQMGEDCNADVMLVHAPASEATFMEKGAGKERMLVMHNDFIIVGPPEDPAGIKGTSSTEEDYQMIADAQAPFVSRGDDSGTHKAELALWKKAGLTPEGEWYIETGQGMGATLKVADEKGAYTLTDRATYLANKDTLGLEILLEGDAALLNVYHVISVNPTACPKVNKTGALAFAKYLTDPETQKTISEFGVDQYGEPLFFPDADKTDADLGLL
ncbi:MAG: tungsten ABC transporter substrate-binding protein [Chloroflexi bacterium RBG_16_54_18]|nr:MAG: tungsten ABC transporter substrate-binding protein [Chloroflexi bacterium RBG_16_54_18]